MPIEVSDFDRRIWEEELADFVPQRVFDAHVHLTAAEHNLAGPGDRSLGRPGEWAATDEALMTIDRPSADRVYARLFPNRELHYAAMPWPFRRIDFCGANAFVASQMAADPASVPVMLVHPAFSAEQVAEAVELQGFRGLKPYANYAENGVECRITDMLPEPLIEVANEKRLFVVLHVSKKLGIADEQNIRDLDVLTRRYPKVRWNLAHLARSSVAWPLERAVDRLKELPNLWFDFSSVTSADVFMIAFRDFSLERMMYGSDIPSDLRRGNMIGFGRGWALLTERDIASMDIDYCDNRCTFVMYETLRALRRAAALACLERQQIEDIFYNNAFRFAHGRVRDSKAVRQG